MWGTREGGWPALGAGCEPCRRASAAARLTKLCTPRRRTARRGSPRSSGRWRCRGRAGGGCGSSLQGCGAGKRGRAEAICHYTASVSVLAIPPACNKRACPWPERILCHPPLGAPLPRRAAALLAHRNIAAGGGGRIGGAGSLGIMPGNAARRCTAHAASVKSKLARASVCSRAAQRAHLHSQGFAGMGASGEPMSVQSSVMHTAMSASAPETVPGT